MAKPSTRRIRFRTGDVFQVALPDGSFAYGRILLDLRRLARAGLFVTPCALAGMCGSALLVRLYKKAFPSPTLSMAELTDAPSFLGELLDRRPIYGGDYPIVGNLPVCPSELDFPEYVCSFHENPAWHFSYQKGGAVAELPMTHKECESLPKPSFSFGYAVDHLLAEIHDPAGREKHARGELRVDPRRDSILARVGLRPGMCYDEICTKVGGPSAEKLLSVQ
jgi:Immunity protein 26